MFKERYKKANDSITDDALREKILNPQPIKARNFVPAYSYGTICAGIIALILMLSNQTNITQSQDVTQNAPVKYEYKGEQFAKAEIQQTPKVRMMDNINTSMEEMAVADKSAFVYKGRYEDILYNTCNTKQSYGLSPFSLENAISIAMNGGDENTKNALISAFNMKDADSQNKKINNIIRQYKNSKDISINIANSVWINKDRTNARFKPEFETTVFKSYNAQCHTVTDKTAVSAINGWVSSNTNGKINQIIANSDFENLIVNTVYFKGSFVNKFNKNLTKKDTFSGNGVTYERDFMEQTSYLDYGKTEDIEIVKLPYSSQDIKVSMFILMGNSRVTNPVSLVETTSLDKRFINLKMPKFEYSYQTSLTPSLAHMGIKNMVFSNMTEGETKGFDIIQKTYINTDEDGTEASAATAILTGSAFGEKPEPYKLKIDKDFTFVIYDETNKIVLFTGEVK